MFLPLGDGAPALSPCWETKPGVVQEHAGVRRAGELALVDGRPPEDAVGDVVHVAPLLVAAAVTPGDPDDLVLAHAGRGVGRGRATHPVHQVHPGVGAVLGVAVHDREVVPVRGPRHRGPGVGRDRLVEPPPAAAVLIGLQQPRRPERGRRADEEDVVALDVAGLLLGEAARGAGRGERVPALLREGEGPPVRRPDRSGGDRPARGDLLLVRARGAHHEDVLAAGRVLLDVGDPLAVRAPPRPVVPARGRELLHRAAGLGHRVDLVRPDERDLPLAPERGGVARRGEETSDQRDQHGDPRDPAHDAHPQRRAASRGRSRP